MNDPRQTTNAHVIVDLHCHSDASDGYYVPDVLAEIFRQAGVDFAALTDHETTAGLEAFHRAAEARGITDISGIELHAVHEGRELHFLCYGFDPARLSLQACKGLAPDDLIRVVHDSGGLVILAHPLQYDWDMAKLKTVLKALAASGLDGIEAYYGVYSPEERDGLAALADELDLLTTGGSDFHGRQPGTVSAGVSMPRDRWRQFREALGEPARKGFHTPRTRESRGFTLDWRWFLLRVALPSLLVIGFFISLIFLFLLPRIEALLMQRRREMTTELTSSASSILKDYHRAAQEGRSTTADAQRDAIERIRHLRYGPDGKDYFWITDMHPRMVMHPYRPELEGEDLSDYTDEDGVRLFVEFVRQVEEHASGYVRYIWQWQDDPDRMMAKESYVRGFEPWGWVIGSGLYIDDVQEEIDSLTASMVDASFAVIAAAVILLSIMAVQTLKLERLRSRAETDMHLSHERYRSLVESSSSGLLLLLGGRCTYANSRLLEMIGSSARELAFLHFQDIIGLPDGKDAWNILDAVSGGRELSEPVEASLKKKNGESIPVLFSVSPVFFSGKQGVLVSIQDISQHWKGQAQFERGRLFAQLQTSHLYLSEPVSRSMAAPVCCTPDTSIADAVQRMNSRQSGAIAVTGTEGQLLGLVTDSDIRRRVATTGIDPGEPVTRIMSAPVITIHESAPVFEALLLEHEQGVRYLAVVDGAHRLTGIMESSRMIRPDLYSPVVLMCQIHAAQSVKDLAAARYRLPVLVDSLLEAGALPESIAQIVSAATDAVTERIIELALQELGPAPARFAFIALGSEARQEQTLATDQDNALLYEMPDSEDNTAAAAYFLKLGELICGNLDKAGYAFCKGGNMANNPRWNQPLSRWKQYYQTWMASPDEEALAFCNVFFDQRTVYGDEALLEDLRRHIARLQVKHQTFASHMALNITRYKVPLGLFGKIVGETTGSGGQTCNIKEPMLPIVTFARLYSLSNAIAAVNTLERMALLQRGDILHEESGQALTEAFSFLLGLRYRHQAAQMKNGEKADNIIDTAALSPTEKSMLKYALSQISLIQKKVSYEFHLSG